MSEQTYSSEWYQDIRETRKAYQATVALQNAIEVRRDRPVVDEDTTVRLIIEIISTKDHGTDVTWQSTATRVLCNWLNGIIT